MTTAFVALEVENFKCFSSPQHLDFASQPDGLHFVRGINLANPRLGANGTGKSSLFDAICWCLYGKTVDGLRSTDIRPWSGGGTTRVALRLRTGGAEHVISRSASPSGLTIDSDRVGQEDIEALVGLSYPLFCQTIVLGQGRPLFYDLSPRDKMELFSTVLDLDRWEERAAAARREAGEYRSLATRLEGELDGVSRTLEVAKENLEAEKARASEWTSRHQEEVREKEAERALVQSRLEAAETELGEAEGRADWAATEADALRSQLDRSEESMRELASTMREAEARVRAAEKDGTAVRGRLARLEDDGVCPTCGQSVQEGGLEEHARELRQELTQADAEQAEAGRILEEARGTREEQQGKHRQQEADYRAFRTQADHESQKARRLASRTAELGAQLTVLRDWLASAEGAENPHRVAVQDARRHLKEAESQVGGLKADLDSAQAGEEQASFWARGFREIRLEVIDEVLGELGAATAQVLEALGLGEWEVRYSVERETKSGTVQRSLGVDITSPSSSGPVRWESWSGGEGQRLRLAGAIALAEVLLEHAGAGSDLMVLDEPTRHMSPEGVRDLCEFLSEYAQQTGRRMFYVDHLAVESSHFASVTSVVNDSSGATVSSA